MIGILRGLVWEIQMGTLCLDVQGVGYEITVTNTVLAEARSGQELSIYTKLIPREDEVCLYGFSTLREKQLFLELLSVAGIGPKGAMAALSSLGAGQLETALASGDISMLTKVPGIGKKTAQRMILELKEKFKGLQTEGETAGISVPTQRSDALESLLVLGFSLDESRQVLTVILRDQPDLDTEQQIKTALQLLSARGK